MHDLAARRTAWVVPAAASGGPFCFCQVSMTALHSATTGPSISGRLSRQRQLASAALACRLNEPPEYTLLMLCREEAVFAARRINSLRWLRWSRPTRRGVSGFTGLKVQHLDAGIAQAFRRMPVGDAELCPRHR